MTGLSPHIAESDTKSERPQTDADAKRKPSKHARTHAHSTHSYEALRYGSGLDRPTKDAGAQT